MVLYIVLYTHYHNSFLLMITIINKIHIYKIYIYCKDQIWLEPRTGMDPGLQSPNNKFVECGIKS